MKRVLVIGSGGAGKSTFSRRLGEAKGIEVIHLDKLHWKPNWTEPPKDEWRKTVESAAQKEEWIMDGNYGGTMDVRLMACDTVIFLDLPRITCIYRVFKRWLRYRNTSRPDMGEGCGEKLNLEFLQWIWSFPKNTRPTIEERLKRFEGEKTIIRLKSKRDVEKFLTSLRAQEN